jgi:hypothetical protein
MKLHEEFKLYENMWENETSLAESARNFYSANNTVQDYVNDVGPYEGGYTLIKTFWLPTNRGKLNIGLISLDSTDGEDGLVCIPSYDTQFIAPFEEAEEVYEMLYTAEAFDDIDAFIDKFVGCSSVESVKKLFDSNIGR